MRVLHRRAPPRTNKHQQQATTLPCSTCQVVATVGEYSGECVGRADGLALEGRADATKACGAAAPRGEDP